MLMLTSVRIAAGCMSAYSHQISEAALFRATQVKGRVKYVARDLDCCAFVPSVVFVSNLALLFKTRHGSGYFGSEE
jgi:hypothetical protein